MKYILLMLFIIGCDYQTNHERIRADAIEFCKCHKGVEHFIYDKNGYELTCKDGTQAKGSGQRVRFIGCNNEGGF